MNSLKKLLIITTFSLLIPFYSLHASAKKNNTLVVGASAVPHAEILNFVKPILKKEGINLKVIVFQDYVLPNKALANKEIDANYFQHLAYLKKQEKIFGYKFVDLGAIHIEPMGLYSKRFKSLKDVKKNTIVLFSNSVADRGRMLSILQQAHLIKLRKFKNPTDIANATFADIVSNPKNLHFNTNIEPSILPSAYKNNEAGLVFINTNYAVAAGINPKKDALFLEKAKDSIYANILVSREDNKNDPKLKALLKALRSKAVKNFILKKYKGEILPVS